MATISARILASMLRGWRESATAPAYVALADRIRLLILDGRVPFSLLDVFLRDTFTGTVIRRCTLRVAATPESLTH